MDEASQLATADLARLVDLTRAVDGKLVLVGDHRQLGAVNAGGLFRLLANDGIAVELTGVWRFANEWERDASLGSATATPGWGRAEPDLPGMELDYGIEL